MNILNTGQLKDFLDNRVETYNRPDFIQSDPICIPHLFTRQQDIEIAALFAAVFAWGNRKTIINKSLELMQLMDMQPYEYCLNQDLERLKRLLDFKHRTFNATDLLYFVEFLQYHYRRNESLETAFIKWGVTVEQMLTGFHRYFFSLEAVPQRTKKHIATPEKGSNCKRLNMFLRWMVRNDNKGVDFGIWKNIQPSQLICPVDVHVARVAKKLGLLQRKQTDWAAAIEVTAALKKFDANDPVRYDFALFGLGVMEKF